MRVNRNLYNLIRSLTSTEKSYFRKYAGRHTIGEKNIYLRLFDEINKITNPENYNENSIKENLKNFTTIGNFSVLKSYLFGMILKSMRAYNSINNIDTLIHNHIEDSRFLFKKKMTGESKESLNRAKKIAYKYEKFDRVYDIIKKERRLVKTTEPGNVDKIEMFNSELIDTAEKIKISAEFIFLNDKTVSLSNKYGVTDTAELKSRFEEILGNKLLSDVKYAGSFYSLLYYYQVHATYHFVMSEYDKAFICYKNMLGMYENNQDMMNENIRNYLLILHNCIDMSDILHKSDEFIFYYDKFTGLMNDPLVEIPENMKSYVLSRSYIFEIRKYTNRGDFDGKKPEIVHLRKKFEENINSIIPEDRIILIFQFVMYYFGCGNYNESLKWLNMIINKEEELRRDLRIECRLLFLIIHYELGNYDLLEYAVKSTYRYLRKTKILRGIEPLILYFIRKSANISGQKQLKELFIELRQKMLLNEEALKNYGFNYLAWVNSRITGLKFPDIVKKNYSLNDELAMLK